MHDVAVAFHQGTLGEDDLIRLPAVLFATAEAGDAVALSLIERQAEEVCAMAVTAISRLGLDASQDIKEIPVVLGGGVLEARNPLLTGAITRRLAEQAPTAVVRIVDAPPVTGAALLGLDYLAADAASPALRPDGDLAERVSQLTTASGRDADGQARALRRRQRDARDPRHALPVMTASANGRWRRHARGTDRADPQDTSTRQRRRRRARARLLEPVTRSAAPR